MYVFDGYLFSYWYKVKHFKTKKQIITYDSVITSYDLRIISSDSVIKAYDLVMEAEESEKSSAAFGEWNLLQCTILSHEDEEEPEKDLLEILKNN